MIPTIDILFFRAEDKYTRVQTHGFEALIRKPIKELIDELDPDEFWQIHRATVVRVDAIEQVSRNFRGHQIVHGHRQESTARNGGTDPVIDLKSPKVFKRCKGQENEEERRKPVRCGRQQRHFGTPRAARLSAARAYQLLRI